MVVGLGLGAADVQHVAALVPGGGVDDPQLRGGGLSAATGEQQDQRVGSDAGFERLEPGPSLAVVVG